MSARSAPRGAPPRARIAMSLALGLLAGAALAAAGEWALVGPRTEANTKLGGQLERLRAENRKTELMVADYDAFRRDAAEIERRFASALASVPTEAELAAALQDLERVAAASGVSLVRFAPGAPARAPAATPVKGGAAAAAPVQISARPISVVVRSGFRDFRALLERLSTYPRLLTVDGFTMKSSNAGGYTLEASIALKCYFKQTPPAAAAR